MNTQKINSGEKFYMHQKIKLNASTQHTYVKKLIFSHKITKGQYTIINEVLLFAIGIGITSLVFLSFHNIETSMEKTATDDQLVTLSNFVINGIVKVVESDENTSLMLKLPKKISERTYKISAENDNLVVFDMNDPRVNATQELFNITADKNINIVDITSSAEYIIIKYTDNTVEISRFK